MYERDMPKMRALALASPEGLVDTIAFVLCTIQMPLQGVKKQLADVRNQGVRSQYLFGSKRAGYAYALLHARVLHAAVLAAVQTDDAVGAINVLSSVPGLGLVKAAFVAQIVGLPVACLDTHNLRKLGLAENAFRLSKTIGPALKRAKIEAYVNVCTSTGGAAHWWNSWCAFVAGSRFNKQLPTADAVSAYHVECLT